MYILFHTYLRTFVSMQHRGEIAEKAIRRSGMSLTELTKRLDKSRRWIYTAFENPNLSLDILIQIGKIIHYDFSQDIFEIHEPQISDVSPVEYDTPNNEHVIYWKEKYYALLEKYNALLEKQQK